MSIEENAQFFSTVSCNGLIESISESLSNQNPLSIPKSCTDFSDLSDTQSTAQGNNSPPTAQSQVTFSQKFNMDAVQEVQEESSTAYVRRIKREIKSLTSSKEKIEVLLKIISNLKQNLNDLDRTALVAKPTSLRDSKESNVNTSSPTISRDDSRRHHLSPNMVYPRRGSLPPQRRKSTTSIDVAFNSPDTPQNICFKEDEKETLTNLLAATPEKIIEKLTSPSFQEEESTLVGSWIAYSYPLFTSTPRILELIITRYKGPNKHASLDILDRFSQIKAPVRLRSLTLLKQLIESREFEFEEKEVRKKLKSCFKELDSPEELLLLKEALKKSKSKKNLVKTVSNPGYHQIPFVFSTMNVNLVAVQLTVIEYDMMSKIKSHEFLHQFWNKKDKEENAPNLTRSIEWFNKITRWFSSQILSENNLDGRVHAISNLILVGNKFKELNNFNGIMEVLSCIHSSSITRLKNTWAVLGKHIQDQLHEFSDLMSPKSNFKNYREALRKAKGPYVPYLGTYLTDFTFLDDCKPNAIDSLVNFDKVKTFGLNLLELYHFKYIQDMTKLPFPLEIVREVLEYLQQYQEWDDKELFKSSKLLENTLDHKTNSKYQKYFEEVNGSTGHLADVNTAPAELTAHDWKYLLVGANLKTYERNQIVLNQGSKNLFFYRVKSGIVRIEKQMGSSALNQIVTRLEVDQTFGEMSVLDTNGITSARVVADSDVVELYQIELTFVFNILQSKAGLSKRFFKNLALTLSKRLRARSASVVGESAPTLAVLTASSLDNTPSDKKEEDSDKKICDMFSLNDQICINEFPCHLKQTMTYNGTLYVMQQNICFCARTFGREVKETISISNILDVSMDEKTNTSLFITVNPKKSSNDRRVIHFRLKKQSCQDAFLIIKGLWEKLRPAGLAQSVTHNFATGSKTKANRKNHENETLVHSSSMVSASSQNLLTPPPSLTLTDTDWKHILEGAKSKIHKRDEVIIQEGQQYQRLYQINRGSCRIEKATQVLGRMETQEMFGEISFLEGGSGAGAAVTVIADEDEVELAIIEGYFINILFHTMHGFAGRFYHHLCKLLSQRITKMDIV
eukprot:TRINITY_DN7892_c0_g1_i1.p1 TRINITY_DN7892_c0_g1~~TRINITY_DN7892_c0_g1_i1.p1  ORF type:complete len:1077 (+),score=244.67 TRINITY_DN7892_c0_g1_i1:35-3265(+)